MRFCIKCGREVQKEELIRGYCSHCFLHSVRVLERWPQVAITICPKCGSLLQKGEWISLTTLSEALGAALSSELRRHLIEGVELQKINVNGHELLDPNTIKLSAILELTVDGKPIKTDQEFRVKIRYRRCPRCVAKTTGKYNYVVQVRFAGVGFSEKLLKEIVLEVLNLVGHSMELSVKESRNGVDIEMNDATLVKKVLEVLTNRYAARLSTSFKATKYDARRGRWIGVTTYAARIPVFDKDCVVIYRNRIGLVKSANLSKLTVWFPGTNTYEEVDLKDYWRGLLRCATRVERELYVVKNVDDNVLLLENPLTGDIRRVKPAGWLKNLKLGDVVNLIKVDNIETLAPGS